MSEPSAEHDLFARQIANLAFAAYSALGPKLLEAACEQWLACEPETCDIPIQRQVALPVGHMHRRGVRMDVAVGSLTAVEIKAAEKILPVREAQLVNFLKIFRLPDWTAHQLQRHSDQARCQALDQRSISWCLGDSAEGGAAWSATMGDRSTFKPQIPH